MGPTSQGPTTSSNLAVEHYLGSCLISATARKHPGAKHSLDALCTRFGVDRSHRVKHGALLDAQLLAQGGYYTKLYQKEFNG